MPLSPEVLVPALATGPYWIGPVVRYGWRYGKRGSMWLARKLGNGR